MTELDAVRDDLAVSWLGLPRDIESCLGDSIVGGCVGDDGGDGLFGGLFGVDVSSGGHG